jgi:glycosyltransferase involved in cell wall biosynthesis
MEPRISVIVPCYNEIGFIQNLLQNIVEQDYPPAKMEVFIVDGMSNDGTREIIGVFNKLYPYIHLEDNEKRYVPFALNKGILKSTGEVIVRMDAHAKYPSDYISRLVESLYQLNADNVGGSWITLPGNPTIKSQAIAFALSSPFGVGNAHYRLNVKSVRQVDTVPFGCYRREVFDRIGLFDEELLRNQDDGFNARLTRNGGRIFLVPDIKIRYYARTSVKSVCKMFYQYGLFKPLGNRKAGRPATLRQFIPPAFVLFLALGALGSLCSKVASFIGLIGLAFYILIDLIFTIAILIKNSQPRLIIYMPWIFFLIHISYGIGYLNGIIKFIILREKKSNVGHTRG